MMQPESDTLQQASSADKKEAIKERVLGIDLRCLPADGSDGAGIAHAAREIAGVLCASSSEEWKLKLYIPRGARFSEELTCHAPMIMLEGATREDLLKGLAESPCDILFVPSGAVTPALPIPAIPWVHDVDIYAHPEWFGESWFTRLRTTWMYRRGLRKAPMIFAVSEYTAKAVKSLNIENNISVTGEGGDESLLATEEIDRKMARERLIGHGVVDSFILMLGTLEPRKNIPFALSVISSLASHVSPLVLAGSDGWKCEPIYHEIEKHSKHIKIIRINEVSEMLRKDLLISASLILVPSLSEGFGLVALEGIQAGVPVLASNQGALSEIVGDTALPLEVNLWKDAIEKAVSDTAYRTDLCAKQKQSASKFSWKKSAEIIWKGLNDLYAKPKEKET